MRPLLLLPTLLSTTPLIHALVSPDGTGRLPALGWNSWNEYGCSINESVFLNVGQKLVSLGLRDLGYNYVNIDDCWSDKVKRRDNITRELVVDTKKFPNGIDGLAKRIHELGLKLGIYGDAGTDTCGGYAGSLGYEDIDAATFSKWGIDYLKYDNCAVPQNWTDTYQYYPEGNSPPPTAPPNYDYSTSKTALRYHTMRNALLSQNRTIQFSLCAWGHAHVEQWGNSTGHSWRMWGDIYPEWTGKYDYSWGIMPILNQASFYWNTSDFWGHSDWDMLEVGNGNLTIEENRSHFALWAALKSPLIIGTPLDTIKPEILRILANKELVAFNQDTVYGAAAFPYNWDGKSNASHPAAYWTGTSVKGIHVFILNTQERAREMSAVFDEIPGLKGKEFLVHDMWSGRDLGVFKGRYTTVVKRHDTIALRITKVDGKHPNPKWTP